MLQRPDVQMGSPHPGSDSVRAVRPGRKRSKELADPARRGISRTCPEVRSAHRVRRAASKDFQDRAAVSSVLPAASVHSPPQLPVPVVPIPGMPPTQRRGRAGLLQVLLPAKPAWWVPAASLTPMASMGTLPTRMASTYSQPSFCILCLSRRFIRSSVATTGTAWRV